MIKKYIQAILKFFLVDSVVNILGNLFEQPLIMWAFIGWCWLAVLAMIASMATTVGAVIGA